MKCLVAVKKVIDPYVDIQIKPDLSGIVTENVKMVIDPFDEVVMEEAYKLKQQNFISEIIAVSIGNHASTDILRQALARDADRAILIQTDLNLSPLNIAKILRAIVIKESINLALLGSQTGQMLAGLLDWPQATFISKLNISPDKAYIEVVREINNGIERLQLNLPAVVTANLSLNKPRYISLNSLMRAKKKNIEIINLENLNLALNLDSIKVLKITAPKLRSRSIKLSNVKELISQLQQDGVI